MAEQNASVQMDVRGGDARLAGKRAIESQMELSQQMMPSDANPLGNVHGGVIMKLIDEAGALAAMRHARRPVVTITMDSVSFLSPVRVGHLLSLRGSVNWVGKTSLEVGVRVMAENPITGEIMHTNSAYAVYVALDDQGKPCSVPPLVLESAEERRRWDDAEERQRIRLQRTQRRE
jgi:uncharacterized protein (TIGR00369 family)